MADLNIDMIGRNWRDTIVAIGKEHSDLGATLARVNRRPSRAPHDRHRRPLAGGALLLPLGPLQLRPEGRADPLLLQRRASGLPPGRPIRPTRSTARRSRGSSGSSTTWAARSATRQRVRSGTPRATGRSWTTAPATERWRSGILRAMADTIADFNAFRTRMNDLILGAGNLTDQPLLRARQPGLRGRRAGHQDEGDAGAVSSLVLRCDDCVDLPRDPLPRGGRHAARSSWRSSRSAWSWAGAS